MEWNDNFVNLFCDGVERFHHNPNAAPDSFFTQDEQIFISSIGSQAREIYGYIAEYAMRGIPSPSTVLLITTVRRHYFMTTQRGMMSSTDLVTEADLAGENEVFHDVPYLLRLMQKAEAKLSGRLSPEIMYFDAKDRACLKQCGNIHPADFLNLVWQCRGDKTKVLTAIKHLIRTNASDEAQA